MAEKKRPRGEERQLEESEPEDIIEALSERLRQRERDLERVINAVETLKKEGLDAYWITSKSKRRGALYKVFVGQFTDTNEATQFQKDKTILKNYPDSFVQEISSPGISP